MNSRSMTAVFLLVFSLFLHAHGQDWEVMTGWRRHLEPGVAPEAQDSLWSWVQSIVDFRVRRSRVI